MSTPSVTLSSPLQLPLVGSSLIEASAGTGKTYTIAALYIRFILAHIKDVGAAAEHGDGSDAAPLLPPNILVVTFTKAATAELKDRIRLRLVEAARWFRQAEDATCDAVDPFLVTLRQSYPIASWARCAQALQTASEWMDEASVKTIHSWCQGLLREHAFSSGSLFSQELTTELQKFRDDAARDYWRNMVYPLQADDYAAVADVASSPQGLAKLSLPLWAMVDDAPPQPLDITALVATKRAEYEARVTEVHRAWQSYLPQLLQFVDEADAQGWLLNKRKVAPNATKKALQPVQAWLDLPVAEAVHALPKVTPAMLDNYSVEGFAQLLSIDTAHLTFTGKLAELKALQDSGPSIKTELLYHAAQWIKHRFSQQLHQHALMSFDDIILQTRKALQQPAGHELAERVRAQYPIAMIDEFQDTDPDQYTIFNTIYRLAEQPANSAIYLIGDPKQAIYAFRGADIFTYLQARRDTAGRHFTLARNFRSSHDMVAASNHVFLPAESSLPKKAFLFNRPNGNQVPFVEVAAHGQQASLVIDGEQVSEALQLWLDENTEDPSKPISKGDYNEQQAASCASYIVSLLQGAEQGLTGIRQADGKLNALRSADIAVLVNSRFEGYLVQQHLRARGVASVYLSDRNSVYDTAVARDVLAILHACAYPQQRQGLTNALYTRLLDVPVSELAHLQHDDLAWDSRVEQFLQYAHSWQTQGVLAMLHQVIHDFDIATRLLSEIGGERESTDLLHLAELLQQAAGMLDGEHALLRFLQEKIYHADEEGSDEQSVRLESDSQLVQIVTVHKSKGLEYPLVFLPFSSASRAIDEKRTLFSYHDDEGELRHSMQATPEVIKQVDEERLGEEIRRLYVALTRSRFACWASVAPVKDWQHSALAYLAGASAGKDSMPADFISQAKRTWSNQPGIRVCPQPAVTNQHWTPPVAQIGQPVVRQMPAQHRFASWWIASYSALKYTGLREPESALEANLYEEDGADAEPAEAVQPVIASEGGPHLHHFPRGAEPGTFLHNILEDAAELGFAVIAEDSQSRQLLIDKRCTHGIWLELREQLDSWLALYVTTLFELDNGQTFSLAGLQHYKAEPEFWFALHQVSARKLDDLIAAHVMPEHPRPALQDNYLNGMLKGFIDLIFEHEGRYYVADYKSNYLGPGDADYTQSAMRDKMLSSRYDVQYVLYTLALHRLLQARLGDAYDYDTHIGGVVYLFLRGHNGAEHGAFFDRPAKALIEQLDSYCKQGAT
ncbi:MAG: exodeoxyribonuclease V subunit beta [Idiomarina sp.]|nr:exodeoxyribonuclease V subunit beta [Idiomarina sp.]